MPEPPTIYTIGHSTRPFDEFVAILQSHGIEAVADVRKFPRSRRYPHFNDESLSLELPKPGIVYLPFPALGGRRRAAKDSINTGWRNDAFRGYADFMQTDEFATALEALMKEAKIRPTSTMCAEAVPWRCHRSLISDALLVRGWRVLDVFDAGKAKEHKLPSFARVEGLTITYPSEQQPLFRSE